MIYIDKVRHKAELYRKASERYFDILSSVSNRASNILFLTYMSWTIPEIKNKFSGINAESAEIYTFSAFIRREINLYWPVIEEKLKEDIKDKSEKLTPYLIDSDISNEIIFSMVEEKRNNGDYFNTITSTNRNIARSIYFNIKAASESNSDIKTTGEKIYYSKRNKDLIERYPYSENDELISGYIEYILNKSAVDPSISMYLYGNVLLKDERYLKAVKKKYKFIIVDCMERINNIEAEFIEKMNDELIEIDIFSCKEMNLSSFSNFDVDNVYNKIYNSGKIRDFKTSDDLKEDYDKDNVYGRKESDIYNKENNELNGIACKYENTSYNHAERLGIFSEKIKGCYQSQLYTEMINDIAEKISDMQREGTELKNINIIMPPASGVTASLLCGEFNKRGIKAVTTIKDTNLYNNRTALGIITAISIYENLMDKTEPYKVTEQGKIALIQGLLGTNSMKSRLIYKKFGNILEDADYEENDISDKKEEADVKVNDDEISGLSDEINENNIYEDNPDVNNDTRDISSDINNDISDINADNIYDEYTIYKNKITDFRKNMDIYIKNKITRGEFARRFYMDNMSDNLKNTENIRICKKIASEYDKLEKAISEGLINKKNEANIILHSINDYVSLTEKRKYDRENLVMITGINEYINSMSKRNVQMWVDVGNPMWSPKISKELGNSEVLKKSYPENQIFTDLYESQIRKEYLYNTMYSLMDGAEEIYVFKSDYSINGFIQDSTMYSWILKLIDN